MNGTVQVQKETLAGIYEDADYGLSLFTDHINNDLVKIEQNIVMLKESGNEV